MTTESELQKIIKGILHIKMKKDIHKHDSISLEELINK
jgi:hypothetical protein